MNAIVPFGIESQPTALIEVQAQNRTLAAAQIPVVAVQPGIFTPDSSGVGGGSILNRRLQCEFNRKPPHAAASLWFLRRDSVR